MMNMRLARPSALIDVLTTPGLGDIDLTDGDGRSEVVVGAAARQATSLSHREVAARILSAAGVA